MSEISSKGKVLLVDDEQIVRESLREWLEMEGFSVQTAVDGNDALCVLRIFPADVAVVDIRMPGMDGITLLGEIIKSFPEVIVVIITAHATVESAVDCMRKGAFDYIIKPFPPEKLTNIITHVVAIQNLQRTQSLLQQQVESADIYLKRAERLMNLGKYAAQVSDDLDAFLLDLLKGLDQIADQTAQIENSEKIRETIANYSKEIMQRLNIIRTIGNITQTLEPERFDISLNETVQNALLLSRRRSEVQSSNFVLHLTENLPLIRGRFWSLVQVCINLIYNAVRATPFDKPIEIVTRTNRVDWVFLTITDSGYGMKETQISRLFDPFYCGWDNCDGVGLGLVVSKRIVESFGGSIKVQSEWEKGTSVSLEFPINNT